MRKARKNHKMLNAIRFPTSLNDKFAMVKSQILLKDPLPDMNKIFSLMLQYERKNSFAPVEDS